MIVKISNYNVIIKDSDFEKFSKYKWSSRTIKGVPYFQANIYINNVHTTMALHRYLMDCIPDDGKIVDHIDGNTLNNDTDNLRICTRSENSRNQKRRSTNTSGYKGVTFNKASGKWVSQIQIVDGRKGLGYFATPELAYKAYCEAVIKYHGEYGRLE